MVQTDKIEVQFLEELNIDVTTSMYIKIGGNARIFVANPSFNIGTFTVIPSTKKSIPLGKVNVLNRTSEANNPIHAFKQSNRSIEYPTPIRSITESENKRIIFVDYNPLMMNPQALMYFQSLIVY